MRKILIVEDNEFNIDLLQQILEDESDILVARNGAEAVRMAEEALPDLILMDLSLPVLNGIDATRTIKANNDLAHIPVVAVTASAMMGDKERALQAGCDGYVTKPIDDVELCRLIERLVPK